MGAFALRRAAVGAQHRQRRPHHRQRHLIHLSAGRARVRATPEAGPAAPAAREAERVLLEAVEGLSGRGQAASARQDAAIAAALDALEAEGGVPRPVDSALISGKWRLVYTSKSDFDPTAPLGRRADGTAPGLESLFKAAGQASSSPIQRTVTSIDVVDVLQDIVLDGPDPRVDQVVLFGDAARLRLSAAASRGTDTDRRRIDFAFDLAYFEVTADLGPLKGFRVPYPVPFRLLGDEAKGWLDTTYLSESVRISRGNKGTTFVLVRDTEERLAF